HAGAQDPGDLRPVPRRGPRLRPAAQQPGVLRHHGGVPGAQPRRTLRGDRRCLRGLVGYGAGRRGGCAGVEGQAAEVSLTDAEVTVLTIRLGKAEWAKAWRAL